MVERLLHTQEVAGSNPASRIFCHFGLFETEAVSEGLTACSPAVSNFGLLPFIATDVNVARVSVADFCGFICGSSFFAAKVESSATASDTESIFASVYVFAVKRISL